MKLRHSKKKAFTIVELIIVIAVIGILAAILIPAFTNMIARANAKSALSDARNTLTAFLAENLEVVDGQIAKSITIFVKKAKMYYVFGYSNTGPEMGKLMQSIGNPFHYEELAELINDYNCTSFTEEQIAAMEAEDLAEYVFFLRTTPSGSGSGLKGTKGATMEEINAEYVNLSDRMADGLPDTTEVFDGFLIGMVVDAGIINPGDGTHPGGIPGG
ncbi:MAG: type II secretion system protein, partial [Clostridiales bacterium]|nr:type II secretion system protein [Clostridiales bacterium]